MVDEAIVNMIIKDSQPFSIVEDVGFRELMHVMDPNYLLPSRKVCEQNQLVIFYIGYHDSSSFHPQALKAMVEAKFWEAKEKTKDQVQVLMSDMWTSINIDAYLAVTCHFIDVKDQLCTTSLGVQHFPKAHTAENLAAGHVQPIEEWGIRDKVKCLVTDGALNAIACVRQLNVRHTVCIAHRITLIVRKSFDDVKGLNVTM